MPRLNTRPLVDRILGGTLRDRLTAQKLAGLSYEEMAATLLRDHDITVTGETVRRWCDEFGIPKTVKPKGKTA